MGLLGGILKDTGTGIGSFITNSRYLSSPTLRGLRAYISENFKSGHFLDLGGQVSERNSSEGSDENVFDISQGVSIGQVFNYPPSSQLTEVKHGRIYGTAVEKKDILNNSSFGHLTTSSIQLSPPLYRFDRGIDVTDNEFNSYPPINRIFPFNSGGIITSRDNLALGFSQEELLEKLHRFANSSKDDISIQEEIGFSVKPKWKVELCKQELRSLLSIPNKISEYIKRIHYRPFDYRYIFYLPSLIDTPSRPVCTTIWSCDNIVLVSPKVKTSAEFTHVLLGRQPAETKLSTHDRASQMFPLYRNNSKTGEPLLQTLLPR